MSSSIYIPRVGINCDEIFMRNAFDKLGIGTVRRIDFVPIESNSRTKKAFVYISSYYTTQRAFEIQEAHTNNRAYWVFPNGESSKYWILLKNRCHTIPETMNNIHQLDQNLKKFVRNQTAQIDDLRESKERMAEQIDDLRASKERMTEQIERLQQTAEQLFGYINLNDEQFDTFCDVLYDYGNLADMGRECLFCTYKTTELKKQDEDDDDDDYTKYEQYKRVNR